MISAGPDRRTHGPKNSSRKAHSTARGSARRLRTLYAGSRLDIPTRPASSPPPCPRPVGIRPACARPGLPSSAGGTRPGGRRRPDRCRRGGRHGAARGRPDPRAWRGTGPSAPAVSGGSRRPVRGGTPRPADPNGWLASRRAGSAVVLHGRPEAMLVQPEHVQLGLLACPVRDNGLPLVVHVQHQGPGLLLAVTEQLLEDEGHV